MSTAVHTYAYLNANLRARISNLLSSTFFDRLSKTHSLNEAFALLQKTAFNEVAQSFDITGDLKMAELVILKHEIAQYRQIRKKCPTRIQDFLDALYTRLEIENLRNALRLFFDRTIRHRDSTSIRHYLIQEPIINSFSIDNIIDAVDYNQIAEILSDTPYGKIVQEMSGQVVDEQTVFWMEISFDRIYYGTILKSLKNLGSRDEFIAAHIIGLEIDLINISRIIRMKAYYSLAEEKISSVIIPNGYSITSEKLHEFYHSRNIAALLEKSLGRNYPGISTILGNTESDSISHLLLVESILNHILMSEVKKMLMGNPFTIGILIAFTILKRSELRKLTTILNAKQYNLPLSRIEGS